MAHESGASAVFMDPSNPRNYPRFRRNVLSWSQLALHLNLSGPEQVKEWMNSEFFQPYWQELYEAVIAPAQLSARVSGTRRPRGPRLSIVQYTLVEGERGGEQTFSRRKLDKSDWDIVDHYARFLYMVRSENKLDKKGVFFARDDLTNEEIDMLIWKALQKKSHETAPSRVRRKLSPKTVQQ
ncbi:hypothetical protein L228DRAFT_152274 [Xylona heveae TC161]|uniref:Uncharacterized protein n=1 Tax=Xylona heveae (strain CBS 132557 / TC161) TaxID=1328760 RepID=A0A165GNR0_XYLHT|nr:hypothetical protein L228DRAFT_152274 [Xylona heveae TC161]KZF22411.1 hypothetical protein L228DRAFT_152274 [Xylona heveae TC161]